MIGQHNLRASIVDTSQHLLVHDFSALYYVNEALPGVTNGEQALDYILGVLFPNTQPEVATPGDLPAVGNTIWDFRIVLDDGDGKAAGYRWFQKEGTAAPAWNKVYDMDWGAGSVLSYLTQQAQDSFVVKYGSRERDAAGAFVAGTYAGQHIYGSTEANEHLTLFANFGDGVGGHTGYVQVDDDFRPTANETYSSGTSTERWLKVFTAALEVGDLTISTTGTTTNFTEANNDIDFGAADLTTTGTITGNIVLAGSTTIAGFTLSEEITPARGQIVHTTGLISFDNEDLVTTGTITGGAGYLTSSLEVGPLAGNALILAPGSITDESGAISFADEDLTTTGNITATNMYASSSMEIGPLAGNALVLAAGSITDESGAISFGNENLSTTGTLGAGVTTVTQLNADNLTLDGNTLSSTDVNGNILVSPNGTGDIGLYGDIIFDADNSYDIGDVTNQLQTLYIQTSIHDGTNAFTIADLMLLKDGAYRDAGRTQPAQAGDVLIWNGSQYLANIADAEVVHENISGLYSGAAIPSTNPDAGHPQFVLLAGRSGGQIIQGGLAASESLTLESTSHATKGVINTKDDFEPFLTAAYSGGWSGTDLGGSTKLWNDVYTAGEFIGFRFENLAADAAFSAQKIGRAFWNTTDSALRVDTGAQIIDIIQSINAQSIGGVKTFTSGTVHERYIATERNDIATSATITALNSDYSFVNFTGSTATELQGVTAGSDGQHLILHNYSSADVTVKHLNAGASDGNKVKTTDGADLVIGASSTVELIYLSSGVAATSFWVVKSISAASGGSSSGVSGAAVWDAGTNSLWSTTSNGWHSVNASGFDANRTLYGDVEAGATSGDVAIKVSNLPIGLYEVYWQGLVKLQDGSGGNADVVMAISDGTVTIGGQAAQDSGAAAGYYTMSTGGVRAVYNNTSVGDRTFTLKAYVTTSTPGSVAVDNDDTNSKMIMGIRPL